MFLTKLFQLTAFSVFNTRPTFYLKDLDSAVVKSELSTGTLSLLNRHKLPDVSK